MARIARPWYWKERDGWYVNVGGKRVRLADGRKNKKLALDKFHELMVEARINPVPDADRPTVLSIIEAYLDHAQRHLVARNYEEQRSLLQRFAEAYGFREVADCKAFHLQQWLDATPEWKSTWTLRRVAATVMRVFNWALKLGLIRCNPFHGVEYGEGTPRRPVTDAEFQALLRGAPGRRGRPFRQVLIFLRYTGCRPAEMAGLTWDQVAWSERRLLLPQHKTVKKTRKPRVIVLTPVVFKLLAHLKVRSEGEFVFINDRGNPWHRSALSLRLQRCRRRQGIPSDATLYGVRHKFGTDAILNGVDLTTTSVLMVHRSVRMTEHYVHLDGEDGHLEQSMRRATSRRPGA